VTMSQHSCWFASLRWLHLQVAVHIISLFVITQGHASAASNIHGVGSIHWQGRQARTLDTVALLGLWSVQVLKIAECVPDVKTGIRAGITRAHCPSLLGRSEDKASAAGCRLCTS
jgi:hypothetical protein